MKTNMTSYFDRWNKFLFGSGTCYSDSILIFPIQKVLLYEEIKERLSSLEQYEKR